MSDRLLLVFACRWLVTELAEGGEILVRSTEGGGGGGNSGGVPLSEANSPLQ